MYVSQSGSLSGLYRPPQLLENDIEEGPGSPLVPRTRSIDRTLKMADKMFPPSLKERQLLSRQRRMSLDVTNPLMQMFKDNRGDMVVNRYKEKASMQPSEYLKCVSPKTRLETPPKVETLSHTNLPLREFEKELKSLFDGYMDAGGLKKFQQLLKGLFEWPFSQSLVQYDVNLLRLKATIKLLSWSMSMSVAGTRDILRERSCRVVKWIQSDEFMQDIGEFVLKPRPKNGLHSPVVVSSLSLSLLIFMGTSIYDVTTDSLTPSGYVKIVALIVGVLGVFQYLNDTYNTSKPKVVPSL